MPRKTAWVSTTEAAEALGVKPKFLREKRDQLFKRGRHYRVVNPEAWRPTYRWHLPNLEKLMSLDEAEYPLAKEVWKE